MDLALAILFLWIGGALLFVAFHPLDLEGVSGTPSDVLKSLQTKIGGAGVAADNLN